MADNEDKKTAGADKKAGAGRGKKNLPKPDEEVVAATTATMEAPAESGRTRPVRKVTQPKEVVEQVINLCSWPF